MFYNEINEAWNKHRIDTLPGYRELKEDIKMCFEEGMLEIKRPFKFNEATLNHMQKQGFDIDCGSAGAKRMSLSLIGVETVTIRWDQER